MSNSKEFWWFIGISKGKNIIVMIRKNRSNDFSYMGGYMWVYAYKIQSRNISCGCSPRDILKKSARNEENILFSSS